MKNGLRKKGGKFLKQCWITLLSTLDYLDAVLVLNKSL